MVRKFFYIAQNGVQWKVSLLPTLGSWADSLAFTSNNTFIGAYWKLSEYMSVYMQTQTHTQAFFYFTR